MNGFLEKLAQDLYSSVIAEARWKMYLEGIGNTLLIALCACLIGITIGTVVAIIKYFAASNRSLRPLELLCDLYTTVIRGTPVVIQLLIIYNVILSDMRNGIPAAILGFGINSGAYVAEIIRSGIFSIDKGQSEAGRSLGLNQTQTMRLIVLPQAVKNILPALFNEFIALLKETSVAGFIAVRDLTKVSDGIRGRIFTQSPLFIAAVVYLVLVIGLTAVLKRLERRLGKSDRR